MSSLRLLMLISGLGLSSAAQALSLGQPQVESLLGQPLRLNLPVLDLGRGVLYSRVILLEGGPLTGLVPGDTSSNGFWSGLDPTSTQPLLQIQTQHPIREPAIRLLVELSQGDIRLQRQYNILLDPPAPSATPQPSPVMTAPKQPQLSLRRRAEPGPAVSLPPTSAPIPPSNPADDEPLRVRAGDSLSRIVQRLPLPAGRSTDEFITALQVANPGAFADPGDVRSLQVGSLLRMPQAAHWNQPAPARSSSKGQRSQALPQDVAVLYLRPGLLGLQTRFESWRQDEVERTQGTLAQQQAEPARFRADWELSGLRSPPRQQPIPTRPISAPAPTQTAQPSAADSIDTAAEENFLEPSTELAEIPQPQETARTIEPEPTKDDFFAEEGFAEEGFAEDESTQEASPAPASALAQAQAQTQASDSGLKLWGLLALLLLAALGWWRWRSASTTTAETLRWEPGDDAPEDAQPQEDSPATEEPEPLPAEDNSHLSPEAQKLLRRLKALPPSTDPAQSNEIKVAEAMIRRDRLDAAARIVSRYEKG